MQAASNPALLLTALEGVGELTRLERRAGAGNAAPRLR